MSAQVRLPASVRELLDGTSLDERVGVTLLVIVGDADWPRVASVSVGEVLAVAGDGLMLTLYETSRTAQALIASGRGLLHLVVDGAIVKIAFTAVPAGEGAGRVVFRCAVDAVESDEVPYARVVDGIRFELLPGHEQVLERWRAQLAQLTELAR